MPRRALDPAGTCIACPAGDMTCPHEQPFDTFLKELLDLGYVSHFDEIDGAFRQKRAGALLQLRRRWVFRLPGARARTLVARFLVVLSLRALDRGVGGPTLRPIGAAARRWRPRSLPPVTGRLLSGSPATAKS